MIKKCGLSHHSHLGKVEEPVLRKVGRALLDEGQVGEVHALQIGSMLPRVLANLMTHDHESTFDAL